MPSRDDMEKMELAWKLVTMGAGIIGMIYFSIADALLVIKFLGMLVSVSLFIIGFVWFMQDGQNKKKVE
jgi:hypothetical protein